MTTKVREIKLKKNQIGVMLDMHKNGKRTQKMLNIRYADVPKDAIDRQDRKEKKELVKKMVAQIELDALYANGIMQKEYKLNKDFFEYCYEYISNLTLAQSENYLSAIKQLEKFTKRNKLSCSEMDEIFMRKYRDYLDIQLNGMTPYLYFKMIKKIIKEATYNKHFLYNPTERIVNRKGKSEEKDVLTENDIQKLQDTYCKNEQIKKAFLFSCLTGLRFSDVSGLKWGNIKDGVIDIVQKKTKQRLILNIHRDARYLSGRPKDSNDSIFELPSLVSCLKQLKKWVKDAEIDKHITWHCSRHTFATILNLKNEPVTVVSKLLGHKNIHETLNYIRVSEMSKVTAINNLPSIFKSKNK